MKIQIVDFNVNLKEPFIYNQARLDYLPYSKIIITDNNGVTGEGEIVNSVDSYGNLQTATIAYVTIIERVLSSYVTIEDLDDIKEAIAKFEVAMYANAGILCGIEQALFQIVSKNTGKSLIEILGGFSNGKKYIQTGIGYLSNTQAYKNKFQNILDTHGIPKYLKIKVGRSLDTELEIIKFAREYFPETILSIDANQSFKNADDALSFLDKLPKNSLSWCEQLLPRSAIEEMKKLSKLSPIPLMADESLHTISDAYFLSQNKLVKYFNIKLAKTGGILNAKKIIEFAEENDIPVLLGSMLHSEIGYRYNFDFALTENFISHDFYSYFLIDSPIEPFVDKNLQILRCK